MPPKRNRRGFFQSPQSPDDDEDDIVQQSELPPKDTVSEDDDDNGIITTPTTTTTPNFSTTTTTTSNNYSQRYLVIVTENARYTDINEFLQQVCLDAPTEAVYANNSNCTFPTDFSNIKAVLYHPGGSSNACKHIGAYFKQCLDNGVGLVFTLFSHYVGNDSNSSNRSFAVPAGHGFLDEWNCFSFGSSYNFNNVELGTIHLTMHPILQHVHKLKHHITVDCAVHSGATLICSYDNGMPCAAERVFANATLVQLNLVAASVKSFSNFWHATEADIPILLKNCLEYVGNKRKSETWKSKMLAYCYKACHYGDVIVVVVVK